MLFETEIRNHIIKAFSELYEIVIVPGQVILQPTRKEFEGDITLVVFALAKIVGKNPEETGTSIGEYLKTKSGLVSDYNFVKGFLNISIHNNLWLSNLSDSIKEKNYGVKSIDSSSTEGPVLVEYSSPNTNKPLHLGHIRNNLLGFSLSEILKANGQHVLKVNIVNDRGIHICKSMLAWKKYGYGETPESTGMKGDHLVGKYYVEFDKHYKEEIRSLEAAGYARDEAEKKAPLMLEAQQMLQLWEAGDAATLHLWKMMNEWVYTGFDLTYKALGVDFDKIYYESETYLLGKKIVEQGLSDGVLYKKPDGSVWADLRDVGLDEKLLLRSDGTAVYMTQDLGTAVLRFQEFGFSKLIYVVGNEQDYHFKVLIHVLRKLGYSWADKLYHLSYNMVDLPSGKMKSREGTVVDADELVDEMISEARKLTMELGKIEDFESTRAKQLFNQLGLGALKYFILKVDPEKRMLFNPNESIDFNGNTGPFIQYTHARIMSVLRKAETVESTKGWEKTDVEKFTDLALRERELIKTILRFPEIVHDAGMSNSPAIVANYTYELAKSYNQFYHEHAIVDQEHLELSKFRLAISALSGQIIKKSLSLLGIEAPEKM